jgi:Zn-dependent protease with chaperone function
MDFFERQEKAHHNTKLLVVYFVAGVAALILTIYLVTALVFSGVMHRRHRHFNYLENDGRHQIKLWNPELFLGVTVGTLTVIIIGSLTKSAELSRGGSAVAEMLGGRLIPSNTTDLDERKLLNVVEEMSLASGVPVPQVFVMDAEKGINAFAAGHSTSDAAVCVTHGAMKLLTRDQLQGVIAHEFSHILNGDMRLNLRLIGIVFGILCLAVIGRVLLSVRSSGRSHSGQNVLPLIGLALLLLGWIGVFFGRLIQAAVSRQREFLADASAVQFTRNPLGLSGALQKIGGLGFGSKLEAAHADEASHLFFANGMGESLFGLMDTHPPLVQRIRAIDPNWDGTFARVSSAELEETPPPVSKADGLRPPLFPIPGRPPLRGAAGMIPPVIAMQSVLPDVGKPTTLHLRYAVALRDSFPPALQNAARDPLGASALTYALLMSSTPEIRAKQLELLGQSSPAARQETERLLPDVANVAMRARLPLVDLALPALRHFSRIQYEEFSRIIHGLIECDGEIDLFEYVLQKIVLRHLDPQFNGARKPVVQYYSLPALAPDCAVLLSALARAGTGDPVQAENAFRQGAQFLGQQAEVELPFLPEDESDLPQLDAALTKLSEAGPQIKKNALDACARTVASDGVIQEMEAELLRAIADALDCPIPPFVQPKERTAPADA